MSTGEPVQIPPRGRVISMPFHRVTRERVSFVAAPTPTRERARTPANVANMLALAHHLQSAIDRGVVGDRTSIAARLGVTKARITQLLDLTLLAPNLQERVLAVEAVEGIEPMSERSLRAFVTTTSWAEQRERWAAVTATRAPAATSRSTTH